MSNNQAEDKGESLQTLCPDGETLRLAIAGKAVARLACLGDTPAKPAMNIHQVLSVIDSLAEQGRKLSGVEVYGPGDPLADLPGTLNAVQTIQTAYPDLAVSIRTVGLGGEEAIASLVDAKIHSLSLEINAVDTDIIGKIYNWIRPGKKTLQMVEAAQILLEEQMKSLAAFCASGIPVSVVSQILPGENDGHLEKVAEKVALAGIKKMILEPYSVEALEKKCVVSNLIDVVKARCEKHLLVEIASHWSCPTDTAKPTGVLGKGRTPEKPNVAVASDNGFDVNLHLGQAKKFLIYGPREDGLVCLLETRKAPESGSGTDRWLSLAALLKDCFLVLTSGAGENPRRVMAEQGIPVYVTEDTVDGLVDVVYGGGKKGKKGRNF